MATNDFLSINRLLQKVFGSLSQYTNINYITNDVLNVSANRKELFTVTETRIETPTPEIIDQLNQFKIPLPDHIEHLHRFENLLQSISDSIIRLNHIAFVYKVESKTDARQQIIDQIHTSKFYVYEEPQTVDPEAVWLFVGNAQNWQEPMLEYVPVEKVTGTTEEYWLPQIHLDLDTTMDAETIRILINGLK